MPRARDRVLQNLEAIYREAYERAKAAGDQARMADLDAAYQREQLLLEVLLDIRDALATAAAPGAESRGDRAEISRTPLLHYPANHGRHSANGQRQHPIRPRVAAGCPMNREE
jgi:hypothetical protein